MSAASTRLRVGHRYRLDDGSEWRVERVGEGSAAVRCVTATPGSIVGERIVRFASGREMTVPVYAAGGHRAGESLTISPWSCVEIVP